MSEECGDLPPVSIVIPTLNEEQYIPLLLESLERIDAPMEIMVIDGGSADATVRAVEKYVPQFSGDRSLRLVSSERGIAAQRNHGAALARHGILLFLDADVLVPSPAHYEKMIAAFEREGYAVASPLIEGIERYMVSDCIYGAFHILQRVYLMFGKAYLPGACMLTRRDVFASVGGFNTAHHVAEDLEYSLKAARAGRAGLLNVRVPTSTRRFRKYGYFAVCSTYMRGAIRVMCTGRIPREVPRYAFGEYSEDNRSPATEP